MSDTQEEILKITRQLYPTGRAFNMEYGSYRYRVHKALAISEAKAFDDSEAILDVIIPDNDNFTADDATDWERRLKMPTNASTPLSDRKLAILRKMSQPGLNPAKGHYLYLQTQLQAAGFQVWVHENLFPLYPSGFEAVPPIDVYAFPAYLSETQFGQCKFGHRKFGSYYNNKVARSLSQRVDNNFNNGGFFWSSFFIGGQTIGTLANVLASREQEFRDLILRIKQVQNFAFLFIQYV